MEIRDEYLKFASEDRKIQKVINKRLNKTIQIYFKKLYIFQIIKNNYWVTNTVFNIIIL